MGFGALKWWALYQISFTAFLVVLSSFDDILKYLMSYFYLCIVYQQLIQEHQDVINIHFI